MSQSKVPIGVTVPIAGLERYAFANETFPHNRMVEDRRSGWGVGRGVPLPKGAVDDVAALRLTTADGTPVPVQARPLATWPDGSVMFAYIDWSAEVAHDAPGSYLLSYAADGDNPLPDGPVMVSQDGDTVTMENGRTRVELMARGAPTLKVTVDGAPVFDGPLVLWTRDAAGQSYTGTVDAVSIIERGPVTGAVEITGRHRNDSGVFLDFSLRLRLNAGRPDLHLAHMFLNLGDEDSVEVGEIGLRLPRAGSVTHSIAQAASGECSIPRMCELPEDVRIDVLLSGVRIADEASLREDTTGYPAYVLDVLSLVKPYIGLHGEGWTATAMLHEASENHPKVLTSDADGLGFHIWPAEHKLPSLRQGMARRHEMTIAFLPPETRGFELPRVYFQYQAPATVTIPFPWFQQCQVMGMETIMDWMPTVYPHLESSLCGTIERGWVSGMMAYGDDPCSSYTSIYNQGGRDGTVWINNEHDYMAQAATQFWRSNRPPAWKCARICAQHQIDVDFVRRSDDPWKVEGIPAHCPGHTTGSVYPSHTWTEGLVQYYLTSGDERALEVVKGLGRNLCKYVEERIAPMRIESRMMGWALIALNAVVEVCHDGRCLRAAQTIRDEIGEVTDTLGAIDRDGLCYGAGTVLSGLAGLHRITGDERALQLLLANLDWHFENGRNAVGTVWCDQLQPYELNLTLPAYAYAWHATKDRRYLDEGIKFFRFTGPPMIILQVRGAGKHYRTHMPFLKVAHDEGILADVSEQYPRRR